MKFKSYRYRISGVVQGVYYRKSVQAEASRLGYSGYVKNMSDGSVEACVTCNEEALDDFIQILKAGSSASRVDHIELLECHEHFEKGFEIRY
jgi:acylphosphatase